MNYLLDENRICFGLPQLFAKLFTWPADASQFKCYFIFINCCFMMNIMMMQHKKKEKKLVMLFKESS